MDTNADKVVKTVLLLFIIAAAVGLCWFAVIETNYADATLRSVDAVYMARVADREKTLNLAMEFGFDPMIVQTVRQLSANALRRNRSRPVMWRFVRTDDDLAYIMLSIISAESGGEVRAVGDSGRAFGLTQMWLTTAQMYDRKITANRLLTIHGNLTLAMNHFLDLLQRYDGNFTLAVLAWNRGSGAVSRSLALGASPENGYSYRVFAQAALRNAVR